MFIIPAAVKTTVVAYYCAARFSTSRTISHFCIQNVHLERSFKRFFTGVWVYFRCLPYFTLFFVHQCIWLWKHSAGGREYTSQLYLLCCIKWGTVRGQNRRLWTLTSEFPQQPGQQLYRPWGCCLSDYLCSLQSFSIEERRRFLASSSFICFCIFLMLFISQS